MKNKYPLFALLFLSNYITNAQGTWQDRNSFYTPQPASSFAVTRDEAFLFSSPTNLYYGSGYRETAFDYYYYHDLYSYDLTTNRWTHLTDPAFSARSQNFSFYIGSKGYVCLGSNLHTGAYFNECWEYDPSNDSWTQKADYPGYRAGLMFSNQLRAYEIFGLDSTNTATNQLYEFNPGANTWLLKSPFPGQVRQNASAFSILNNSYVIGGRDTLFNALNDVWMYDASNDSWNQKNNCIRNGVFKNAIGTLSNGYIYDNHDSAYAYDPTLDLWTVKNPLPSEFDIYSLTFNNQHIFAVNNSVSVYQYDELNDTWQMKYGSPKYIGFSHAIIMNQKAYCDSNVYDFASDSWAVDTGIKNVSDWIFSIADSGYTFLNGIFSVYDPIAKTWNARSQYPGVSVNGPYTKFSIGTKGYLGINDSISDFWEYDALTNVWTQKSDYPGGPRYMASGFTIGQKGYVYSGWSDTAYYSIDDFWEYDPIADTWTQKNSLNVGGRYNCIASGGNNKGYVGLGYEQIGNEYDDIFEYDQLTGAWTQISNPFPGPFNMRSQPVNFVYNDQLYAGGGGTRWGGMSAPGYSNYEFMVYNPSPLTNIHNIKSINSLLLYPNIVEEFTTFSSLTPHNTVEIYDELGHLVMSFNTDKQKQELNLHQLLPGIYFLRTLSSGDGIKFIKQ